jgi:hypothetical protein
MNTIITRCLAAPVLGAAIIGGAAVGLASVANASVAPAPTATVTDPAGPLPHNNDSFFAHPAFPGYNSGHGMPGYSPSIHIGKHSGR